MDKLIGGFVIFLGLNFLLDNFGLPSVDLGDLFRLWPLALIWVGWNIWRDGNGRGCRNDSLD